MTALDLPAPQHGGPLFAVTTEPRLFSPLDERETPCSPGPSPTRRWCTRGSTSG